MPQQFKHLLPSERQIWRAFIQREGQDYKPFEYDVHVGKASALWKTGNPNYDRMADALLKKRIDAVSKKENVLHIFEVKPDAGLSAIGQLLSYEVLYRQEFKYEGRIDLHLVTNLIDVDTENICNSKGIIVHLVEVVV